MACTPAGYTNVAVNGGITLIAPHGALVDSNTPERLSYVTGPWRIDVIDGRLMLNGEPFGRVQAGDTVKLTKEGRLLVNGRPRNPGAG